MCGDEKDEARRWPRGRRRLRFRATRRRAITRSARSSTSTGWSCQCSTNAADMPRSVARARGTGHVLADTASRVMGREDESHERSALLARQGSRRRFRYGGRSACCRACTRSGRESGDPTLAGCPDTCSAVCRERGETPPIAFVAPCQVGQLFGSLVDVRDARRCNKASI